MDQNLEDYALSTRPGSARTRHPLEPLTPAEIRAAVAIVRRDPEFATGIFFETIELREPSARESGRPPAAPGRPGQRVPRRGGRVWRLIVSLDDDTVTSRRFVEVRGR